MTVIGHQTASRVFHGAALVSALLAMLGLMLVPPGFMPGAPGAASLVVCTGHGPLTLQGMSDQAPAKSGHAGRSQAACAFAGHGVVTPDLGTAPTLVTQSRYERAADPQSPDLSPGRGLAAPPPPSQAPPTFL